ncbi:MAG TPA: hypothetical protein VHE37_01160 [Nevskiaceae bacterium]|nr:hypothetical protein [Nevskiaceae bacterium]
MSSHRVAPRRRWNSTWVVLLLAGCTAGQDSAVPGAPADMGKADVTPAVFEGPVPRAVCGANSLPETDIQGRVSIDDRSSGRSQQGYRCNLELVGQYQGQGTTWVSQSYKNCAYHSQTFPTSLQGPSPGVQVVDVSDPKHPVLAGTLTSPAFLGNTWESLKVNEARGLLAGVQVGIGEGAVFFDVYDIGTDCLHPKLLNSVGPTQLSIPADSIGHEGNWSPDGNTYWSTSLAGGIVTAIDVSDPALPRALFVGNAGIVNHGFELSADGNRLYLANVAPEGLDILDVSEIQSRKLAPQMHKLGSVTWTDGSTGQHSIPVSWNGKPYLVFVDEGGNGAARIIDISDETAPVVVSKLKLEIHMPEYAEQRTADLAGNGSFGYEGHYCTVDRRENPTAIACGYFQSGVRVFDVRDPMNPHEIAYYNPPAQVGKSAQLTGSEHANGLLQVYAPANLTADWCSSPPRFVEQADGERQLWVTCQDNGFMVLKFTNGSYPVADVAPVVTPVVSAPSTGRYGAALAWSLLLPLFAAALRRRR